MKSLINNFVKLTMVLVLMQVGIVRAENPSGLDDLPVVLSASRLIQPLVEAPSAVTLIDRSMIEASGVRHVADLMRFVPGAIVGYNDGNRPVVSLHGMNGAYASGVQVLVDGVSVYSPIWGGMQWEELPLSISDIERIEVIRGPNAAIFGPNSVAGVINIITKEPAAEKGWRLESSIGEGGVSDFSATYSGSTANGFALRATAGQRSSDGFKTRPDTQRQLFGNLTAGFQIDAHDSLRLSARWADNRKMTGDYTALGSSSQPHQVGTDRFDFQVRWTSAASADEELWLQYSHQQSKTRDKVQLDFRDTAQYAQFNAILAGLPFPFGPGPLPFASPIPYVFDSSFESQRDGIEVQQTRRLSPALRAVWGAEVRRDSALSDLLFYSGAQQTSSLWRAYGNLEWQFAPRWTLHFADMIERNTLANTAWSPKGTLSFQPVPGHVLRASVSSAQRTPSLLEDKGVIGFATPSVILSSPAFIPVAFVMKAAGLDPARPVLFRATGRANNEVTQTEELGYAFTLPELGLSGDMRWYWEHNHGLLLSKPGPTGIADFYNVDRVDVEGGDITVKWQPRPETMLRFAYGSNWVRSSTDPASFNGSAPSSTFGLFWDEKLSNSLRFSSNYQRVGSMHWLDAGSSNGNQSLPPIEYLNLRLASDFSLLEYCDSSIALVIQNALGRHREYFAGLARNGTSETVASRLTYLQLSLRF